MKFIDSRETKVDVNQLETGSSFLYNNSVYIVLGPRSKDLRDVDDIYVFNCTTKCLTILNRFVEVTPVDITITY